MKLRTILVALAVAAVGVPTASAVMVTGDENAQTTYLKDKTVITVTQSGKLYVTEPGEIELLVVGGGGGAGAASGNTSGANGGGGGGGGVIHKQSFAVTVGEYDVTIGAGGAVNSGARPSGGNTVAFDLTAYGGGCGAKGEAFTLGTDGASGGGGTKGWTAEQNPTKAKYRGEPYNNLGNDGGAAVSIYNPGGGGGAGTAANGTVGGDGYPCSISGTEVYYAGGGGGSGANGKGGGNTSFGGGGKSGQTGGPGVVIVSFVRSVKPCSEDFAVSGGNRRYFDETGTAVAFTSDGTLTVTGDGFVDILLVGGGGGGGANYVDSSWNTYGGGGGGGGGVRHVLAFPVMAGDYDIVVGQGGSVGVIGGDTTAFDMTAKGGGCGAKNQAQVVGRDGASGGGGTMNWNTTVNPTAAVYTGSPYFNLGHKGGSPLSPYWSGGGGGAGAEASGNVGGDGYCCLISGEEVYYAGGGGGVNGKAGLGGGTAGIGGGGAGGAACPNIDWSYGGGGGAGGVIHKTSYILAAGDYPIVVGVGGIVTQYTDATAKGGKTTAFDFTAWGGGYGAKGGGFTTAETGASGGGGTIGWDASSKKPGRDPSPSCVGNLGNRGGDPGGVYASGGGGGAGGAGDSAGNGGIGYACGITGTEVYYAGGGNGNTGATTPAQGSGNTCFGGGGNFGTNGGAGVVIVRYRSPDTGLVITVK